MSDHTIRIIVEGKALSDESIDRLIVEINKAVNDYELIENRNMSWLERVIEWFKT